MSDLIEREDAIDVVKKNHYRLEGHGLTEELLIEQMRSIPSADRPRGEWIKDDLTWGRSIYACSVCEEAIAVPCGWSDGKPIYDYCPMCGARLKGADDE